MTVTQSQWIDRLTIAVYSNLMSSIAAKNGNKLVLSLGLSHPVELEEPNGITIDVPAANKIIVKGADKQLVGEIAAKIRSFRLPDAYKGKGIRYEKELIRIKEGKTGAKK